MRGDRGRELLSVPRLDLTPGGSLGISGPSGSGKSTFLFAVAGLLKAASGTVAWGDAAITAMGEARRAAFRAERIGIVFQDFLLFDELGAADNAAIAALYAPRGARDGIRARAGDLLSRLGLADEDRPVPGLSGGERQRVAVARAMAGNADILLADEPTANLDRPTATRLVDDLLVRCRERGASLIAVSHDETLLARLDRRIEIRDGKVRLDG
ncbi:ATP-binding cassette domain-containing protein [uncultured Jannaschia sp.]|uniref:ABC transporter ATP-binding protein n=1 Tax=uncultured Jannaschia sp. TaxID=293347 RepID=UPI002632F15D|nr:ATP-binding cassette domain-containing protein [uncultured Jannaschia sp.]